MEVTEILMEYAKQYNVKVFIETGTGDGQTVGAMLKSGLFTQLHTIDRKIDLAAHARRRYNVPCLHCWSGDSQQRLPVILRNIHEGTLFYLDARPKAGSVSSSRGKIPPALPQELLAILTHPHAKDHVIVIGEAPYYKKFGRKYKAYPSLKDIELKVKEYFPDWIVAVVGDWIVCRAQKGNGTPTEQLGQDTAIPLRPDVPAP